MSRNGKRFMKILVLSYEAWNDITNGNNVTSNWFEGMDAEFANIYASPGNLIINAVRNTTRSLTV